MSKDVYDSPSSDIGDGVSFSNNPTFNKKLIWVMILLLVYLLPGVFSYGYIYPGEYSSWYFRWVYLAVYLLLLLSVILYLKERWKLFRFASKWSLFGASIAVINPVVTYKFPVFTNVPFCFLVNLKSGASIQVGFDLIVGLFAVAILYLSRKQKLDMDIYKSQNE